MAVQSESGSSSTAAIQAFRHPSIVAAPSTSTKGTAGRTESAYQYRSNCLDTSNATGPTNLANGQALPSDGEARCMVAYDRVVKDKHHIDQGEHAIPDPKLVSTHYTHGSLVDVITAGVHKLGKTVATVSVDDLSPVDEFHVGGRVATEALLEQLSIQADHHVLDVGCGLGGASRVAATRYNCRVTGIDLTAEYVETGNKLCSWVGLGERVRLSVGDGTALAQADASFDRAFLIHVGMNIADKAALAAELYRIVRPGGYIGIYDIMRIEDGELTYPVPWAAGPDASALASPAEYKAALTAAGFSIVAERNRRDFALDFFARMKERTKSLGGPPPLGIHILMGDSAPQKLKNMVGSIARNLLAPVELLASKPARL